MHPRERKGDQSSDDHVLDLTVRGVDRALNRERK